MTHLRIEQNNIQENVSSAVIEKLYELATSGDLDLSSNLAGNLHTTATYLEYIDAIRAEYPDLTISATTTYMMFEDPEVLNKLKNWVGDGVGVIASLFLAATTLPASYNGSSLFFLNTAITKFNELSRAINLTTLADGAFKGASNLELIDISNITSVGQSTFSACKKCLFTGQGLSNLQHMKKESFQLCWNLSGAVNISNLLDTDIKDFCFLECKTITSIAIPTTVTSLGTNVFLNCTALTTCTGFSNITSITNHCFNGCSLLTSIDIDWSKLTSIGEGAFNNCSSLSSAVVIPNTVTYIGSMAFLQCRNIPSITFQTGGSGNLHFGGALWDGPFEGTYSVSKIIFPENLTYLANGALNIANDETKIFVFTSVTPPSVDSQAAYALGVGLNGHTIYVPDASVTAYQNALGSNLSGKIYPVSQMPT